MVYEEKTYSEIVADMTAYIIANTDKINDFNVGSVIRTLIEAYGYELSSEENDTLYQQLTAVYEGTKIDTATGYDLEQLGALLGVTRKEGVESSGNVTFARTTPASADFDILSGSVVSTQPVVGEDSIRFIVNNTTTFEASVSSEDHTFVDGIYNYPLTQRLLDSVTSMTAIVSAVSTPLTSPGDFTIEEFDDEVVETDTIEVIDDCDSLTGWSGTTDTQTPTLDTSDFKQGTASINLGKNGTSTTVFALSKTVSTPVDITNKKLLLHFYYTSALTTVNNIEVRVGSSATDYIKWTIDPADLEDGWNFVKLNTDDASFNGGPVFDDLDYIYVGGQTNASGDTITLGDLKMDFIIVSATSEYEGDLIQFVTRPDDGTTFTTTYVPLSVEVTVTAEEPGTDYNVGSHKIVYMVSEIPGIVNIDNYEAFTNGEDEEEDDDYRDRIKESSTVGGHSTVNAIVADIESLDYIKSASVDDMPTKQEDAEPITFSTGTSEYQLQYEVAQNDSYRKITGYEDDLDGGIDDSQVSITLTDATNFPTSGKVLIDDEVITYTGKSVNDLTGCTRGTNGTAAAAHSDAAVVAHWFAPDTDYLFTEESKVEFKGVDDPQDTEPLKVWYQYRWLGHIEIFVIGFNALTTAQLNDLNDKITNDYKAAGIWYELTTPISSAVNVTANIHILAGYTYDTVKANVIDAIRDRINEYAIGEDVRISQLYDAIQDVAGVDYSDITTPASDVTIASDEIASPGTIVINQI